VKKKLTAEGTEDTEFFLENSSRSLRLCGSKKISDSKNNRRATGNTDFFLRILRGLCAFAVKKN
jgi:hypothetical protein